MTACLMGKGCVFGQTNLSMTDINGKDTKAGLQPLIQGQMVITQKMANVRKHLHIINTVKVKQHCLN